MSFFRKKIIQSLFTKGLIFASVLFLYSMGFLERFENLIMDQHFTNAPKLPSKNLIVIEIDPESLRELNTWPWSRTYYARALENLLKAKAKNIAFDIDFSSKSNDISDQIFSDALKKSNGKVILSSFKQFISKQVSAAKTIEALPLEMFQKYTSVGSVNVFPNKYGHVREFYIANSFDGSFRTSLISYLTEKQTFDISRFYIDYSIDPSQIPRISFVDIYNNNFDPNIIKNKHVIIGATAIELGDKLATPNHGVIPGVIIQALAYESIVNDRMIVKLHPFFGFLIAFLLVFFFLPALHKKSWAIAIISYLFMTAVIYGMALFSQEYLSLAIEIMPIYTALYLSFIVVITKVIRRQTLSIIKEKMENAYRTTLMNQVVSDSFNGIVITDHNGRIQICNDSARTFLKLEENQDITNLSIFDYIPDILEVVLSLRDDFTDTVDNLQTQHTTKLEREIEDDDLNSCLIELVISKSITKTIIDRDVKNTVSSEIFTYTFRDITAEKKAHEAERKATDELVSTNRAKTEFLTNMSHELRTPLNSIIGFSDMIKDQLLGPIENEKYVEYSHDINKSGQKLLSIVNDILDVSKIETGKFDLNISIIDPYDILRSCENIFKGWPAIKARNFITNYESDLPLLEVDARLIKQIIINLLSNAVKFTADDGEITLSAGMNLKKEFYITVRDNGIGIEEDEIKRVTDAFYQIDGSLSRNQDGTGLGLHLVTKFIGLHDGKLEIESTVSQGTLMRVTIPPAHIVLTEENLNNEVQADDPHETLYFSQTK